MNQFKRPADQLRSSTNQHSHTEKASQLESSLQCSPVFTSSAGPLFYSADVRRTASTGAKFAHIEDISSNALFAGDRNLDNFDRNRDRKFTQHPVALASVIVHNTKTSDEHHIPSSTTTAREDYTAYHICVEPIRKSTKDTADIVRSLSNKDEGVSNVIEHVKARLKSRDESLTSESKHSTSVAPTSFGQASLPPASEQTTNVDYRSIVHSTEEHSSGDIIPISADPSPPRVLERSSESASEKYKEARDKILRASNIKVLSTKSNDSCVLRNLHVTPASRQHLESSLQLSATQTDVSSNLVKSSVTQQNHTLTSYEVSASLKEGPRAVQESGTRGSNEWNHKLHSVISSHEQHKLPPVINETTETSTPTKQYSSSLAEHTSTGVANCETPDARVVDSTKPATLTDIQKLGKGERPSNSKAHVSSLAWTFSPSVTQDKCLTFTHLKRSHSLNLKVVKCSPSDKSEERLPLHEILISDSHSTHRGAGYTGTLTHENQPVHFDPSAPHVGTLASLADPPTVQTTAVNQSSGYSESESNSEPAVTSSLNDPTAMQSKIKSKIKRSKPLGRSLTESHIVRPQIYTSHLEIKMEPKSKDTKDCASSLLNEPTKWTAGNIGDQCLMDSVQKQCDLMTEPTKRGTDNSSRFLSRSHVNLSHIDTYSPLTVQLVQNDLSNNAFKQSSTFQTDVKFAPDYKGTPGPEYIQTETASSAPQIHDSSVCSRQPKTTMEKAFSLLLEELDKMGSPEGHPSDLDLSDCEEWTTINSGSGSIKDIVAPRSPQPEPVYVSERSARIEDGVLVSDCFNEKRPDLHPVNVDKEEMASLTGVPTTQRCDGEVTLLVQARSDGLSAQENVRTPRMLSSLALSLPLHQSALSLPLHQSALSLPLHQSALSLPLHQSALSNPDPRPPSPDTVPIPEADFTSRAADDAVTRQECSSDRMLHPVSRVTEDKTRNTSVNDYTTDDAIHSLDSNTTSGAQASNVVMDKDLGEAISSDNSVLLNHSYTANMADWDTTDGINHCSITSTAAKLGQPQANANKFLSTRTIDVSEDHEGTITVQAVAEDYNQNKVVTVRTKKLRTPSNANEELRDTIIERKKLSPGGAVLVERDVIQTKNRLTSRGSNYYSRSAYTLKSRREQGGAQTVEHSVCVESENKSVSQGHSWGDKAEAQVTLVGTSSAASVCQLPSSAADEIPSASEEDMRNHHFSQLDILPRTSRGDHSNGVPGMKTTNGGSESAAGHCQVLPSFDKRLTDVSVTEGHSTILSCTVTEAVCVEWYQNGALKRNSADFKQSYDGREARLQIGEVFLDDAGEYTCVAKNSAGEQRDACRLHVIACDQETVVVPMFLTKLASRQVMEGGRLLLECDVIGSPEPSITWLKDGRQLASSLTYSSSYDGRVASLQIPAMRFQDAGCYMCVAENPAGKVSIDAIVTVQVKDQAPHFVARLENKSAVSGERIILQCEVTGSPLPLICWRKDGRLVQTSSNCVQSFYGGVARLEIMQASAQDSACYECVASNPVSELSCQCHVQVVQQKYQPEETTAPRDEQNTASLQKVSRHRVVKKLSEPRPADIIAAVIQRASSHGVQRAQSFTPGSSTTSRERFMGSHAVDDQCGHSHLHNAHSTVHQPQTLSVVRDTITIPPRSNIHARLTDSSNISLQGKELSTNPDTQLEKHYGISRTPSEKTESSPYTASTSLRVTNLGRSSSMNVGQSCNWLPSGHNMQSSASVKSLWTSPSTDQLAPRETIIKSHSQEDVSDLRPTSPIVGYRHVLPVFSTPQEHEKLAHSSSIKYLSSSGSSASNSHSGTVLIEQVAEKERNYKPLSLTPSHSSSLSLKRSYGSEIKEPYNMSPAPLSTSVCSVTPSRLAQNSSSQDSPQLLQDTSQSKPQVPSVNVLRQHFLKNDQAATASVTNSSTRNPTGSGVRRWDSLPPQRSKPIVFQRTSAPGSSRLPSMPAYDTITDEEELHKMMNATEDFEERKKIRARIREIRDKQREEMEAKRKQREAEAEDLVKKKFERAEEEKRKKMEAYKQQAPTHERDSKYHEVSQNLIQEKYKAAEEEKARKLAAYSSMAAKKGSAGSETTTTTSITTEKTPGGGVRTVTQKTSETKGFGGTSYGKPAAKPQGAKSAMAAFKQMDNTNNPDAGAAKPKAMVRSPNAIKQILLDWAKAMTQGYPEVEVTNFSTSWNNGMAFCALIHHFFPNAFDFSKLDPKQRRYNFTLAFDTAEKEADIAPLLDVEDMVKMKNPDWKCVFTYVQSIYRHLKDHENNKAGPIEQ